MNDAGSVSARVRVVDVADHILDTLGRLTAMKLQKLVYYAQAWSLAWTDRPLFGEPIEAWTNGPVVPDLYALHRSEFWVDAVGGDRSALSDQQRAIVDTVLATYGKVSAQALVDLTHGEEPWRRARVGLEPGSRGNVVIGWRLMRDYYRDLPGMSASGR